MKAVYMILNKYNNKIYIGATKNYEDRIKQHLRALKNGRHHNKELLNDFQNNKADLHFSILFEPDDMNEVYIKEEYYINHFNSKIKGYNKADGGKYNRGYEQSDYAKRIASQVHSQKIGELNSFYGKKHSQESKKKMSESLKSRKPRKLSEEELKKFIENNPKSKKVYFKGQIFRSYTEASKYVNIDRKKIAKMAMDDSILDVYDVK